MDFAAGCIGGIFMYINKLDVLKDSLSSKMKSKWRSDITKKCI